MTTKPTYSREGIHFFGDYQNASNLIMMHHPVGSNWTSMNGYRAMLQRAFPTPDVAFVLCDAPFKQSRQMPVWYDMKGINPENRQERTHAGVEPFKELIGLVCNEADLEPSDIHLFGYSHGANMILYYLTQMEHAVGSAVAITGMLPRTEIPPVEHTVPRADVLIPAGYKDFVHSVEDTVYSAQVLAQQHRVHYLLGMDEGHSTNDVMESMIVGFYNEMLTLPQEAYE